MNKITSLTKEQEEKIPEFVEKWVGSITVPANREQAESAIDKVYENCGFKHPYVIFTRSPIENYVYGVVFDFLDEQGLNVNEHKKDILEIIEYTYDKLTDKNYKRDVESVYKEIKKFFGKNPGRTITDVKEVFANNFSKLVNNTYNASTCFYWQLSWLAFFDYAQYIGVKLDKDYDLYHDFVANISNGLFYDKLVIVNDKIQSIKWKENRLHNSDGKSVEFPDGFGIYSWNGILVDGKWITNPESITGEDIRKETNIEKRRCIMEILGTTEFFKRMNVEEIHREKRQYSYYKGKYFARSEEVVYIGIEDFDEMDIGDDIRKEMVLVNDEQEAILYQLKENDPITRRRDKYVKVTCTSTGKEYVLGVENDINDAWEAVAWTFGLKKDEYHPVVET